MKNPNDNAICQDLAQNLTKIFQDNIKDFDIDYVSSGIFEYGDGFVLLLAPFDSEEAELATNEVKRVAKQNSESIVQTIKQATQENGEVVEVEFDCEEIFMDNYGKYDIDLSEVIEISLPFRAYEQ
ncbi:hypothetical protein [Helicobacter macacae]|uniref:Uncharacterized protein n=1 Tax=Helicobacter macacae MIT 99-5501 TaxID=1357400 RepID=V8C5Z6_9HELI|nr:hypothetical protein [Helicobacter macacae]ETD22794.1 hypothetical protein HMPREF2086_01593 [Helicobacter macacae MIT 99-5501]